MTDISNKFNLYYNVFQYNDTAAPVNCNFDVSLIFPLVQKMNDYKISVVKAKFDLSGYVPPVGNPIDKLLINSSSISVIGSLYANNLQSQTILDVDNDQTSADQILYFVPYYPQCLTMASDQPLQRVQINVLVQLEDGTQRPLLLAPNKSWSCRLLLSRLF